MSSSSLNCRDSPKSPVFCFHKTQQFPNDELGPLNLPFLPVGRSDSFAIEYHLEENYFSSPQPHCKTNP